MLACVLWSSHVGYTFVTATGGTTRARSVPHQRTSSSLHSTITIREDSEGANIFNERFPKLRIYDRSWMMDSIVAATFLHGGSCLILLFEFAFVN